MPMTSRAVRRPLLPPLAGGLLIALAAIAMPLQPAAAVDVQRVVSPGGIEAWLIRDPKTVAMRIDLVTAFGDDEADLGRYAW